MASFRKKPESDQLALLNTAEEKPDMAPPGETNEKPEEAAANDNSEDQGNHPKSNQSSVKSNQSKTLSNDSNGELTKEEKRDSLKKRGSQKENEELQEKKQAAIEKIELLSLADDPEQGVDNPAYQSDEESNISSGYNSNYNSHDMPMKRPLRHTESYLDAVGRKPSYLKDPKTKSGDIVMNFRPQRDGMDYDSDEDDSGSVCVIKDTDSLLEKKMYSV